LHRLEVYNWGTFHGRIWGLDLHGDNCLVTGDIGSGKSTLIDAVTTLLVPRVSYNKAAGAEARERSLRSYVLGYHKSERGEAGLSARPVALRDHNAYAVVLGRFHNEGFDQPVTLAQVLWFKEPQGQPARLYVVADKPLSIAEHFSGFGTDVADLRKRLRASSRVELHDSFPPYAAAFRRRFGIDNEQALDLFHQTVSMKSVGNLTDFVRQHMLEAFPVEPRIEALIRHFDDLSRAHAAVLKARDQIERLTPLIADCDRHAKGSAGVHGLRACREALRAWFAGQKAVLLTKRMAAIAADITRLSEQIRVLDDKRSARQAERDDLKRAIAESGGDRIEGLKKEIRALDEEKERRARRAAQYDSFARTVGLPGAADADAFFANRRTIDAEREAAAAREADAQNAETEATVGFRQLKDRHDELNEEIDSLCRRRSNIPKRILDLREMLCRTIGVGEAELPFAGELLQVREEERAWEGAAERLLHSFGLSLLVPDVHYAAVAAWVDRTHLGERLVYFRIREGRAAGVALQGTSGLHPQSLVRKLAIKPESAFYGWLDAELARRFDLACCDDLDQFRRERQAVTRAGQIKAGGERHEKDDRHRIDDRSRYVLGWSNEAKLAVLQKQAGDLEARLGAAAETIAVLQADRKALQERLATLEKLAVFETYADLDWASPAVEIERLRSERRRLEDESDLLKALQAQLGDLEASLQTIETDLAAKQKERNRAEQREDDARRLLTDAKAELAALSADRQAELFPKLEAVQAEALGEHTLTVESCDNRERDMRDWLQGKIDALEKQVRGLAEKIVKAMQEYRNAYPADTQEADASVAAADAYSAMLAVLVSDDLPRFEARFKELLNENTIREVANFQSQLARERQTIRERIATINGSLEDIDYNPGRYIVLEASPSMDPETRDFQQDLRACTEGTLTGSADEVYSEAKFMQVKRVIERFRGRNGTTELDHRWTAKVTDVRNWFVFSASERWREDGREYEHYTDSSGKSGGQKEKLAYTVLAASLAYQFGLDWGATRSRSFRFVVIDEAFSRGSDDSARYGLELFHRLNLQLLIVTPLQKIHVIEPFVAAVGFVHNEEGRLSMLRNLTIEEYRAERAARAG
jgi:uncharacterized protein YPO0396